MKRSPLTIAIGAVLIVIFGLLLFMYQVRKSETAVIARFGKVDRVNSQPGPGFRLPWPIETVYTLDERIQNFDTHMDELTLPDQNIILLTCYVGWKIEKPEEFFVKFDRGSIPAAESILEEDVRGAKNEVAGQHPFPDFVSADPRLMKYRQIESEILDKVQGKIANQHYGLDVKFIHIKQIALPETVSQNVFDRMTQERQYYIDKITAEGAEQARRIKADADKTALITLADADSTALKLKGQGVAEMVQSLQVFRQNPELATFNLKIEALQQLFRSNSTFIVDPSMPPVNLLQLDNKTAPAATPGNAATIADPNK